MSGTSLDGVDAALVHFENNHPTVVATDYIPFPDELRTEALALHQATGNELHRTALLGNALADIYAEAVLNLLRKYPLPTSLIAAIGCHGQTLRHCPGDGYTLQINNPARIAEQTGIAVVADFRSRDVAAGGQGAPLVPAFHAEIFRHPAESRAVLNLGGIANLTYLPCQGMVLGFDCGPANMLLDAWAQRHLHQPCDREGHWSSSGRIVPELLERLMRHPFLGQSPPKSCGREQFSISWLETQLDPQFSAADVQATLVAYTATSVRNAVIRWCPDTEALFVCGGGARNPVLMAALSSTLPAIRISDTGTLGIPPEQVEAIAFAWLARQHVLGRTGNLPAVTGAQGARILGAHYPV
ncbi:MAG: anhydro-N-acetylmuramic acid kinase [Proteobacteria bacterium]|nr:anhydro-N-acetylmuramic acid kinase [Pseudomonadota bacterium]